MTLSLGVCPCCVPPIALTLLSTGLTIVLSARSFFSRSGRVGRALKWLSYLLGFLVLVVAAFLVALKSSPQLQSKFFAAFCEALSSDPKMQPPRCDRLGLSTELAGLDVLEFGPGPGTNFACFEASPSTAPKSWVGVEPNQHFAAAQDRAAQNLTFPREVRWYKGEHVDVDEGSVDAVYMTHVLCSVDDPVAVLEQAARALKPGGRILMMEHVAAADGTWLRALQKALAPVVEIVAAGCEWRDTAGTLLASPDFEDVGVTSFVADAMPLPFRPHILATATRKGGVASI